MTAARGVGLVEVAVALLVLSVGWAAVVGLHGLVVEAGVEAAVVDEARWALQAVADSLDRAGGGSGRVDLAWGWVAWTDGFGGLLLEAWSRRTGRLAILWTRGGGS